MDPPSYNEVSLQPPTQGQVAPPPSYDVSLSLPSTPPPTYGEADHFPVLTLPTVAPRTEPQQNTGFIIHPNTQVMVNQSRSVTQTSPAVIYQPQPVVTVIPTQLTDSPGQVLCPHCGRTGTTKVAFVPSPEAWCCCLLMALMGLICGFCLIPLLLRSSQHAHHSCPHCNKIVHVYKR